MSRRRLDVDDATCTCGLCLMRFARLAAFDAHRHRGVCLSPLDAGLVAVRDRPGVWDVPAQPVLPVTFGHLLSGR